MKKRPTAAQRAVRKGRRRRMFDADAVCILCGWSNPIALRTIGRTLLEEHHVVGVNNNDDARIPVCRNCHELLSEACRDLGAEMGTQRSLLETLAEMLRIRCVFERASADVEAQIAIKLDKFVESLDKECPNWRSLCEINKE